MPLQRIVWIAGGSVHGIHTAQSARGLGISGTRGNDTATAQESRRVFAGRAVIDGQGRMPFSASRDQRRDYSGLRKGMPDRVRRFWLALDRTAVDVEQEQHRTLRKKN